MKRPWKVPFRKNSKLQSCLALSLGLHLLVLFGLTHRERVTQYPVLPPIMVKFTKRPPPQRSLTRRQRPQQRPLVRRPALQAAPVVAQRPAPTASRRLPVFKTLDAAAADRVAAGSAGAAGAGFPGAAHWTTPANWCARRDAARRGRDRLVLRANGRAGDGHRAAPGDGGG